MNFNLVYFITYLGNQEDRNAMLCTDIFIKHCVVVPIKSQNVSDLSFVLLEHLTIIGHKPEIIYSDGENSFGHKVSDK